MFFPLVEIWAGRDGDIAPPFLVHVCVNLFRLRRFGFWQGDGQDTVLVLSLDLVCRHRGRQRHRALEFAKEALRPIDLGFLVFLFRLAFAGDALRPVVQRNVNAPYRGSPINDAESKAQSDVA
jgi:hypothetical protein